MLTLEECLKDVKYIEEVTLVELSDKLWELGTLEKIKEEVSPELFTLHVGMNMIGNWKGSGWWGVISEHAELAPFVADTLEAFRLPALKTAFENVISCFPEDTVFSNDDTYYDTINFLQNVRFKVSNERLNTISIENRKEMVNNIHRYLEELEQLTEPLWGYSCENNGWKTVLDFISAHK